MTDKSKSDDFDFEEYLNTEVGPNATAIDREPMVLAKYLREILSRLRSMEHPKTVVLLTPDQLEQLFSKSTALAFTLWQHLSAVERLLGIEEWQTRNPQLWEEISSGRTLCGLATTNLGRPGGAGVNGKETEAGFILNGSAPWVCGNGIFDLLLVGFETLDSVVFSIIEAPEKTLSEQNQVSIHKMSCLNGTATYKLTFTERVVSHSATVSRKIKTGPPIPRPSRYVIPELGIALNAMSETNKIALSSSHPKQKFVNEALTELNHRVQQLKSKRDSNEDTEVLIPLRDELIRDAVRLFVLANGATALAADSLASRLQLEVLLLDCVVQQPKVIENKIRMTSKAKIDS